MWIKPSFELIYQRSIQFSLFDNTIYLWMNLFQMWTPVFFISYGCLAELLTQKLQPFANVSVLINLLTYHVWKYQIYGVPSFYWSAPGGGYKQFDLSK